MEVNYRLQKFCVWCGPACIVTYLIAFWPIAHFVSPPSPHWTAAHIAHFYAQHSFSIKLGMVLGLASSTLLFPFFGVISAQIVRAERSRNEKAFPILAMLQFGGAILLLVFFALCSMIWCVAAFRTGAPPSTIRMLNDFGWLVFVMVFPAYTMQMLCMSIAGFMDKSDHPAWPRPLAYFTLWVAVSGGGGGIAVFFKHGAFAWNGLIGFYIPLGVFCVWCLVTARSLLSSINHQAAAAKAAEHSSANPQSVQVG